MKTVAFHTLGCKVNQYDTQAMLECFKRAGYQVVPFGGAADIFVINTCTVTGTGDKKSLQMARRLKRTYPDSELVLCGCLAQRKGAELLNTGARLIIGTQHRLEVVQLLEKAIEADEHICCINEFGASTPFEPMLVTDQEEHTRAVMKIQEGCNNCCTYCIIPSVRGPIRSRSIEDITKEGTLLSEAGYHEIVVTGIHLTSYGKDLKNGTTLADALQALHDLPDVWRIRLGSLEPVIATKEFAARLGSMPKVCPQFHLALQSGSETVLRRMQRRYTMAMYREAVANIREVFPDAAFTSDILTGFPGETESEWQETADAISEIGFARIHVFPYSIREGTKAAVMPGQLSKNEKEDRARRLILIGNTTAEEYAKRWLNRESDVILETKDSAGHWHGYTPEYIAVTIPDRNEFRTGQLVRVRLDSVCENGMTAYPV